MSQPPPSEFWATQYGNIASVIGLLITLIGFAVTIINVAKAKKSAEQARTIANELFNQFGSRLFLGHISEAIRLLNDLRNDCRAKTWERAVYHGEHLQRALIALFESTRLRAEEQGQVTASIDDLSLLLRRIEIDLGKSKTPQLTANHNKFMWDLLIFLTHLDSRLKNPNQENNDDTKN